MTPMDMTSLPSVQMLFINVAPVPVIFGVLCPFLAAKRIYPELAFITFSLVQSSLRFARLYHAAHKCASGVSINAMLFFAVVFLDL